MTMIGIGDLAQSFVLRRANVEAKSEAQRLGQELSTGVTSDPGTHLRGDYRLFAALERQLGLVEAQAASAGAAAGFATVQQTALGRVSDQLDAMVAGRGALPLSPDPGQVALASRDSASRFAAMADALGTTFADRSVFAGDTPDTPALASAADMMTALRGAVAGLTDPAAIASAVTQWFTAPAGGFETLGYLGSDNPRSPVPLGDERIGLDLRADDPALRMAMASAALGALASDPALGLSPDTAHALVRRAGEDALAAQGEVTQLRANLGVVEARLEDATARLASERSASELARQQLLEADPFETAVQLEATRTRLESLYAVTARLSRLSLAERL